MPLQWDCFGGKDLLGISSMASLTFARESISLIGPLTPLHGSSPAGAAPSADIATKWNQIDDEIARIRELTDDWDGQGASSPVAENVESAMNWIGEMRRYSQAIPPSQVVPGVRGEVRL